MLTQFVRGLENYPPQDNQKAVVTIGTFDGIHRGHQAIFQRVRQVAEETGLNPVLVTFHPHPRVVINPASVPMLLTSLEEKKQFVPHFFGGTVLILEFDEALKDLSAEDFVKTVLVDQLNTSKLIVGYDHTLGRDRAGTTTELTRLGHQFGFEVEIVQPIMNEGAPVSSTRIRAAMADSRQYQKALELLGHDYAIFGTVQRGIGLGRKLGYPTANVGYSERKLLPPQGVYSCWAQIGSEEKDGMMFIGQNHFNPAASITVEANIFDFDRDIYDEEITVYPTHFLRTNRKFDSTEALIAQIEIDKKDVLEITRKGESTCR